MLALHCQIRNYNFQDEHEVTLSRLLDDGKTRRLSWDKELVGRDDNDERVFLATRQLSDTSVVYFMSITDVVKEDAGTYECKVVDSSSFEIISADKVSVDVNYFPTDSNPECQMVRPTANTPVRSGDLVTFNCSTTDGFPQVDIAWSRTGYQYTDRGRSLPVDVSRMDGRASGIVTFRATRRHHNEAVFSCTVTSPEFPGLETRCHIGPLKVLPNPNYDEDLLPTDFPTDKFQNFASTIKPNDVDNNNNKPSKPVITSTTIDCKQLCSSIEGGSSVQFWIISTVVGGLLAFLFCLLGVCLSCKIRRESRHVARQQHLQFVRSRSSQPQPADDMYESLDRRNVEAKVYMAIERLEKGGNPAMMFPVHHGDVGGKTVEEVHYNMTPNNNTPKY